MVATYNYVFTEYVALSGKVGYGSSPPLTKNSRGMPREAIKCGREWQVYNRKQLVLVENTIDDIQRIATRADQRFGKERRL